MPRDPNIPDAFDVYTMVLLRRAPDAPAISDEDLDALQARHLAYRAGLRRDGVLVAAGRIDGWEHEPIVADVAGNVTIADQLP